MYKNIHDVGTRPEEFGSNFDDIVYSTISFTFGTLTRFGIYINNITKVGELVSIKLTTSTIFNGNDYPSALQTYHYYVPSAIGNDGQILVSTGNGDNPFTYGDKSIKYLHFNQGTTPPSSASFSGTQGTTSKNSGSAVNVASSTHTHTVTATGNVTLSGTRTTSGEGTAARRTLKITASFSGTSASTGAPSGTTPVAPNEHTHTITPSGNVTFTNGTAPSLTSNTTSTNGIKYNEDIS